MDNRNKTITGGLLKKHFQSAIIRTKYQAAKDLGNKIDILRFHRFKRVWNKTLKFHSKMKSIININARAFPLINHPNASHMRDKSNTFYQWTNKRLQGGSRKHSTQFSNLQIFKRLNRDQKMQIRIVEFEVWAKQEGEKVQTIFIAKLQDELNQYVKNVEKEILNNIKGR